LQFVYIEGWNCACRIRAPHHERGQTLY
jgi:hypothetical protein